MRGRSPIAVALLATILTTACLDLEVLNQNAADLERALATPGDVESLISSSYKSWFNATYNWNGFAVTSGLFLSNIAFQHNSPWQNWDMVYRSWIPRPAIENDPNYSRYPVMASIWVGSYQAISAVANGLRALENPEVAEGVDPEEVHRIRTFGKFVQGLAHGTVALLYDQGFVLDETTDLSEPGVPLDYQDLMEAAFGYFDEAIELGSGASFSVPFEWIPAQLTSQDLVRLMRSYRARLRAQVARTPEERAAVDWDAVIADVDGGIQESLIFHMDWNAGWYQAVLDWGTFPNWSTLSYFMYGMADQGGTVAEWYALPITEKQPNLPDGRPVLIITPDTRFPQGSTVEEQRANEGEYVRVYAAGEGHSKRPDRGTWRWSWYRTGLGGGMDYFMAENYDQPEITLEEMRLLKAEGLYRKGDRTGAAAIVNETRTLHGLSATNASGTNPSCVPRLPGGECGDLWEMLKWEKRMEVRFTGIAGVNWYFDGRGWGDLWKDTPLQFPVPCSELEVLRLTPCYTFGGPGGVMSAPVSIYNFTGEG